MPGFQSWLLLKFDNIPTEKEALQIVLNKHTAKNVPKKKTARQIKKPNGPARFDFSSTEFINILEEKENKKNESVKRKAKGSAQEGKRQKTEKAVKTGAKQKLRV